MDGVDSCTLRDPATGRSVTVLHDYARRALIVRTGEGSEKTIPIHEESKMLPIIAYAKSAMKNFDSLFPFEASKSILYQ